MPLSNGLGLCSATSALSLGFQKRVYTLRFVLGVNWLVTFFHTSDSPTLVKPVLFSNAQTPLKTSVQQEASENAHSNRKTLSTSLQAPSLGGLARRGACRASGGQAEQTQVQRGLLSRRFAPHAVAAYGIRDGARLPDEKPSITAARPRYHTERHKPLADSLKALHGPALWSSEELLRGCLGPSQRNDAKGSKARGLPSPPRCTEHHALAWLRACLAPKKTLISRVHAPGMPGLL